MFPWQSSTTDREQRNFIIYNLAFFSVRCGNDFSCSISISDLALQMRRAMLGLALKVLDLELSSATAKHWQKPETLFRAAPAFCSLFADGLPGGPR